jgi:hypothetical protein
MERVEVLIDRLKQQFLEKAGKDQLMITVSMLQAELANTPSAREHNGRKGVAVIMPSAPAYISAQEPVAEVKKAPQEKVVEILEVDEKAIAAELEMIKQAAEKKNAYSVHGRYVAGEAEDEFDEIPTLASHSAYLPPVSVPVTEKEIKKEVNEFIVNNESSLNERLKESKVELADRLNDSPVKDLKKAIGINDRYLYIIELFNGNESMYDRSIKTLNSFSILPEAEFWMERELKIKLGWQEDKPIVRQFIQLVRRRFS